MGFMSPESEKNWPGSEELGLISPEPSSENDMIHWVRG